MYMEGPSSCDRVKFPRVFEETKGKKECVLVLLGRIADDVPTTNHLSNLEFIISDAQLERERK